MARKRHTAEEIVSKLRQVDVPTTQGRPVAEAVTVIGVTEVIYRVLWVFRLSSTRCTSRPGDTPCSSYRSRSAAGRSSTSVSPTAQQRVHGRAALVEHAGMPADVGLDRQSQPNRQPDRGRAEFVDAVLELDRRPVVPGRARQRSAPGDQIPAQYCQLDVKLQQGKRAWREPVGRLRIDNVYIQRLGSF
jgi:hypothetical protein